MSPPSALPPRWALFNPPPVYCTTGLFICVCLVLFFCFFLPIALISETKCAATVCGRTTKVVKQKMGHRHKHQRDGSYSYCYCGFGEDYTFNSPLICFSIFFVDVVDVFSQLNGKKKISFRFFLQQRMTHLRLPNC